MNGDCAVRDWRSLQVIVVVSVHSSTKARLSQRHMTSGRVQRGCHVICVLVKDPCDHPPERIPEIHATFRSSILIHQHGIDVFTYLIAGVISHVLILSPLHPLLETRTADWQTFAGKCSRFVCDAYLHILCFPCGGRILAPLHVIVVWVMMREPPKHQPLLLHIDLEV